MCQESGLRGMGRVTHVIRALFAALILLASLARATAAESRVASGGTDPQSAVKQILVGAARNLGWPATISLPSDLAGGSWQITMDGKAQQPVLRAAIRVTPGHDQPTLLDQLESQGFSRGVYHGWEAIITSSGDRICAEEELMGDADSDGVTSCQEAHGIIAWRCGPYSFLAEDLTGGERETEIAEALYTAAKDQDVCGLGSTVVILTETDDTPGTESLVRFRAIAEAVNRYYRFNGYGRADFDFTFKDADGYRGQHDGYAVGPSLAEYAGNTYGYAVDAVRAAFAGADLPPVVYLERAIIVYAGKGSQSDPTRPLTSHTLKLPADHTIEVSAAGHGVRLYVPNLILVSETDSLGDWVHELGHTLRAQGEGDAEVYGRLVDRYSMPNASVQGGEVGDWDLMGRGNYRGNPYGTSPTQMSSYTKVAAGWLRYRSASLDHTYTLTAVENQTMGDAVLRLDDPLSDDPHCYYIIEARDAEAPFGAPESGVMIYHVTYEAGYPVVEALDCQARITMSFSGEVTFERSTLHGAAKMHGAKEYAIPGGRVVKLVAESFAPYRATVRVERRSHE